MKITTGKIKMPQRVVVYGPEGIGKSSLAAQFPRPLFIDLERGTMQLDVARTQAPSSWAMLKGMVSDLRRDRQGFETLALDTADAMERLCLRHICDVGQKASIEDFAYGGGFVKMSEEWARLMNELTELCHGGMHVVILAHSWLRKCEQPHEFGVYDRFEMKLSKHIAPLTKEWADMVLFMNYETLVVHDDKTKRAKAAGGERAIHTEHHVCWDAKNRHGLPARLPFPREGAFGAIAHCFRAVGGGEAPPSEKSGGEAPPRDMAGAMRGRGETGGGEATPSETAQKPAPQAPQRAPQQKPAPQAPQRGAVTMAADPTSFNTALYDLMERDGITAQEVQAAVASRGYFPADTPIHNYPEEFVMGCLVATWDKVKAIILQQR